MTMTAPGELPARRQTDAQGRLGGHHPLIGGAANAVGAKIFAGHGLVPRFTDAEWIIPLWFGNSGVFDKKKGPPCGDP